MIPKIIHYCWLSGEAYPPLVEKCISSWKKKMPDYQIILWDRNKIDIDSVLWLKESIENRKYAFASDYIRFYSLYNYGGIYLDADVEVLKSFDPLLNNTEFLCEEVGGDIEAAVIGVRKGTEWVKECLDYYTDRPFVKENGKMDMQPVPLLVSEIAKKYNLNIFPFDFFSPKDYNIGKITITNNTFCIHHFDGKWLKRGWKYCIKRNMHKILYCLFGRIGHNKLVQIIRKCK